MTRLLKIFGVLIGLFILTFAAVGAGVALDRSGLLPGSAPHGPAEEPKQFAIFWQAWEIVQGHFVDRQALDPKNLTYGAIRGMVQALGDEGHTTFLTPSEREQQQTELSGKFSGIGAQLGVRDSLPVIVAPFDGSPAQKAGVKAGDIIMKVDGEDVTTMTLNQIVSKIRGPEGTKVVLTLLRPADTKSVEITITRGEITVPAATWAVVPGTKVALIRLSQFSANAKDDIVAAIKGARDQGANAVIVDVRNNPGGLLEQAISVTSQFIKDGNVLLEEDAQGQRKPYPVEPGGLATDMPMVVLVNPGTASSAEIFAGAIQDHKRGQVVGETTFGTGTVLQPFVLDDGSELLVGTKQWLTPNGRLIRKHGITPDVEVKLAIGTDLVSPGAVKDMTLDKLESSTDTQLLKALELLGAIPKTDTQPQSGTKTSTP